MSRRSVRADAGLSEGRRRLGGRGLFPHRGQGTRRFLEGGDTRVGWLIGAGAEWAWDPNWSVNFEYNYMDFGDEDISLSDGTRTAAFGIDQEMHAVKVGLNYRIDWSR